MTSTLKAEPSSALTVWRALPGSSHDADGPGTGPAGTGAVDEEL
ncbi:hypothetical protein AB4Y67_01110 [Arthrobacter sp. YAF17]